MKSPAIDIGINEAQRVEIANGLKVLLADSYTLYLQTHNFHWNITGPQFRELHLMFEEHYTELALAVDLINARRVDVKPLISDTLPIADAVRAFELASDRAHSMKVQLVMQ